MSTWPREHGAWRGAAGYVAAAAAVAVFAWVYLRYSHGVSSPFMAWAFLIPLLAGALPRLLVPAVASGRYLRAAVATLTVGSLVQGALEIYGTASAWVVVYPLVGGVLVATAALRGLSHCGAHRRGAQPRERLDPHP